MYLRRRIRFRHTMAESWVVLVLVGAWSFAIVCLHEIYGYTWLVMPVLPVTLIGIAVSLYLGFKSVSAYNRWWEARVAIGGIGSATREWVMQVQGLLYDDRGNVPHDAERELIHRHLGWLYSVAYMLRRTSRLKVSERTRLFEHRRIGHDLPTMHESPESYGRFLDPGEFAAAQKLRNPAAYLIRRQAASLRSLATSGYLDSVRHYELAALLARLDSFHGTCERIKHTPFPRQIAYFGTVFTWLFITLLPFAFLDVFEGDAGKHSFSTIVTHEFVFSLIPFAMLVSWIFFMIEKIGDSSEDPFEGGVNDVPLSALLRTSEIDLRQALGEEEIPAPIEVVDEVLY